MDRLNFELSTEIGKQWLDFLPVEPTTTLGYSELPKLIGETPTQVLQPDQDQGVCQSGYCYSQQPNTAVFAGNNQWLKTAIESKFVSLIFTTQPTLDALNRDPGKLTIADERSHHWFNLLHNQAIHRRTYQHAEDALFVAPSAKVHETALLRGAVFIDEEVSVGPYCVITGPTYIGPRTRVEELVTIGSRGLFAKKNNGLLQEFNYYGGVMIGSNTHIHARANVAAAPHFLNFTQVGENVSVGISANIGHDCVIHDGCTIASTACICGRGVLGEEAWVGAGAIISEGCTVGSNVKVRIGAVVIDDVESDGDVSGNFAVSHKRNLREFIKRT